MKAFLDQIASGTSGIERELVYLAGMLVFGSLVVFGFILPVAGVSSWVERRVWGRIQSRIGPNRVGPQGFFQWIADGIKNLLKEDVVPAAVDPRLFRIAPYVSVTGFVAAFVAVPFAGSLIIADLNIGILYITAATSLVVVGILMAGWSSNNKWSMLGGIRSATQIVSYEIPAGLAIFPAVLLSGTLSMQGIIRAQGWSPVDWHMFHSPFTLAAFLLFFLAALAEGNRTPFDLPEAESELVAGFATEYSGMRSLLFFLAEWGNLYLIGALVATLYMGGWQVPPFTTNPALRTAAEFLTFFVKAYFWAFVAMWIRATLPRVRVDQLMAVCWKYMVPIGLTCVVGTAVLIAAFPGGLRPMRYAMVAVVVAVLVQFARRVRYHLRRASGPLR
ncbi:MAG: NADH-quinone oxidoreductase subunit NuoH [Candidatus Dadabacteria bacterium]|nr:MAG: NADH-quinone oxidoreductase subunit NuoH [Candidatus Dadabacteria bacterium]